MKIARFATAALVAAASYVSVPATAAPRHGWHAKKVCKMVRQGHRAKRACRMARVRY